ncbi:MAG: hypothetical protein WCK49_04090, partial [Myxococcaceae bacterium]
LGVAFQLLQVVVSIFQHNENRDLTGDPWNGRNLEWSTSSPPPFYNFAIIPEVKELDAFWESKQELLVKDRNYQPFQMPKNTCIGLLIGVFGFLFCFGVIWCIHWLSMSALVAIFISMIIRLSDPETEYTVSIAEIQKIEGSNA